MSFVRNIIESNRLKGIVDIPEELKNRKVEIIVLPLSEEDEKRERNFYPEEYIGLLKIKDSQKEIQTIRKEWDRL